MKKININFDLKEKKDKVVDWIKTNPAEATKIVCSISGVAISAALTYKHNCVNEGLYEKALEELVTNNVLPKEKF